MTNHAFVFINERQHKVIVVDVTQSQAQAAIETQFPQNKWRVHSILGKIAENIYTLPVM